MFFEFFLENKNRIVGCDLAGNEVGFPCRIFKDAFLPLRKTNAQITVHAGEGTGPEVKIVRKENKTAAGPFCF